MNVIIHLPIRRLAAKIDQSLKHKYLIFPALRFRNNTTAAETFKLLQSIFYFQKALYGEKYIFESNKF